jgi:hypothetical protein
MSYIALMDKQLLRTFRLLKDLTIYATFTKAKSASFDFATGVTSVSKEAAKTVPLVEVGKQKVKKESSTTTKTLIARAADLGDLNQYESFQFHDATWKVGTVVKQTGLVYMFEVVKNG